MNKLVTDRPSEWKDWIIEQIDGIEKDGIDVNSIGLVVLPKDIRNDSALTAYYNVVHVDMVMMREHIGMDIMDEFMESNIDKYVDKTEIVFNADTSNDENDENEIEGGEYQDEDVKKG